MAIPEDRRPPGARAFNGQTLDFDRDPNTGRYLSRHWVDAAVFFYLRTAQGSVRSVPDIGETISKIRYINGKTEQQVIDRALSALTNLIAKNRIRVVSVEVDLRVRGAILYQVNYVNLLTSIPNTTPKLSFSP